MNYPCHSERNEESENHRHSEQSEESPNPIRTLSGAEMNYPYHSEQSEESSSNIICQ